MHGRRVLSTVLLAATVVATGGVSAVGATRPTPPTRPAVGPAAATPGGATAYGRVTSHGAPVAGVIVHAGDADEPGVMGTVVSTTTAANGTYTLAGIDAEPGQDARVCFDGGTVGELGYVPVCESAPLVDEHATEIDARVHGGGAVAGTVTDDSGAPLAGVLVTAYGDHFDYDTPQRPETATSAADGSYRIAGLATDTYRVCYAAAAATGGTTTTGYVDACFGKTTQKPYTTIPATVGTTTSQDLTVTTGAAVSGSVVDASTGTPVAGASLFVDEVVVVSDSAGHFLVSGLPAGRTTACGGTGGTGDAPYGYLPAGNCPSFTAKAGQTTTAPTLKLTHAGGIIGRIVDSSGKGVAGVIVSRSPEVTTDASGHFLITGLRSGTYRLCYVTVGVAGRSGTGYLPGCYQPPRGTLRVSANKPATSVGEIVAAVGAAVTGQVTDDATGVAVPGVVVTMTINGTQAAQVETDARGRYAAFGLPAGPARVAFDGYAVNTAAAPDGLGPATVTGSTSAGTTTTVDQGLSAEGAVSGTVIDSAGRPLDHAVLVGTDQGGADVLPTPFATYPDGRFLATGIAPSPPGGTTTVCFNGRVAYDGTHFRYGKACVQVVVTARKTTKHIDVTLKPH